MRPEEFGELAQPLPVPPIPDRLPDLYTKRQRETWQTPVSDPAELALPEGYEPCKSKAGMYVSPLDRMGVLRKPGEQWWEGSYLDGRIVPVLGFWRGNIGARYRMFDGFKERELCGAFDQKKREWCTIKSDECIRHCGAWSARGGRTCARPRRKGWNACFIHTKSKKKGIENPAFNLATFLDNGYPVLLEDGTADKISKMLSGADSTTKPEIMLMREQLGKLYAEKGNASAIYMKQKDAWNRLVNAKGEDDVDKAFREIGKLIQDGVDVVTANEEMRKSSETVGKLISINEGIKRDAQNTVTETQLQAALAVFISFVTKRWGHDRENLIGFTDDVRAFIAGKPLPEK